MNNNFIETFDLTKIYRLKGKKKEITALNKINISIKEGEIFGLLGPNGAGKTTIIHILTTLKQPTSGYATIDGYNILKTPKKAKSRVALMLESSMLYYRITAYDNLRFFCMIYGIKNYKEKIFKFAKDFGLEKWLNQYVENFSSGMKMKLALLRTFLLNKPLVFFDEPTLGLDVNTVSFIVKKIKNIGSTVFLTSHDMRIVEKLSDRIAFIDKGQIIKIGTKEDLKDLEKIEIKIEIKINQDKSKLYNELSQLDYVKEIIETKEGFILSLVNRDYYDKLLFILSKFKIRMFKEIDISLEYLFMKLIRPGEN